MLMESRKMDKSWKGRYIYVQIHFSAQENNLHFWIDIPLQSLPSLWKKIHLCKYISSRKIRRSICANKLHHLHHKKIYQGSWCSRGEKTYRMMKKDLTCRAFYAPHLIEHQWRIRAGSRICSGHASADVFGHFICKYAHSNPPDGLIRCVISQ